MDTCGFDSHRMYHEETMNIFVLDKDPVVAARMQCDKHVVKMVLETAQILCSAFENAPYRRTHYNHPCSIWARESKANYKWLIIHGIALADEFQFRFGKTHASKKVVIWCLKQYCSSLDMSNIKDSLTPFAQAMPKEIRNKDPVIAYRNYYKNNKASIAKWSHGRQQPDWW